MRSETCIITENLEIICFNIKKMREKWENKDINDCNDRIKRIMEIIALIYATNKEEIKEIMDSLTLPFNIEENINKIIEEVYSNK